jgi:hypothetical protein
MHHILTVLWIFIPLTAMAGCATQKESNTAQTGTEQLLLSSAIDKCLNNFDFSLLNSKQVYLETKYLDGIDKNYVTLALKHRIMNQGALLLDKPEKADIVVEVASGAVGTDVQELFVGVPEIPLPPPSPIAIPRLAIFTRNKLNGTAKLLVVAYDAKTRRPIFPTGMSLARSDQKNINILGAGPVQYGSVPKEIASATKEMDMSLTTAGNFALGAYESSPGPFYVMNPKEPINQVAAPVMMNPNSQFAGPVIINNRPSNQVAGPATNNPNNVVPAGYNLVSPSR